MAAMDVRILAPIPGRSAIGVEVPNHTRQMVSLGDILAGAEAKTRHPPARGGDRQGHRRPGVMMNLATMPAPAHRRGHRRRQVERASTASSRRSSCAATPDQVRLILVDPKQVEMGQYKRLPHLLTQPVTDPKKAANALAWAVQGDGAPLRRAGRGRLPRHHRLQRRLRPGRPEARAGRRRLPRYERLPYIVVVVDELNDLMMVAARDVEESITRIAQKARAVGIHLIVATQRPSVNVITGVIKANMPARIAFAVSSLTDSRVILDQPGAERLVGQGDMLLLPGSTNVPQRIQGAWVSEEEVRKVVAHWRRQAARGADVEWRRRRRRGVGPAGRRRRRRRGGDGDDDDDASCARPWTSSCGASSARRRCCSASSGSVSPGPGASWTCSSSAASSARPRGPRPGRCS